MDPASLRELNISSFYGNLSPGELESLFIALGDHCDPQSFEAVCLSVHELIDAVDYMDHYYGWEESIDHPPFIIPFRALKPFLSDYSSLSIF